MGPKVLVCRQKGQVVLGVHESSGGSVGGFVSAAWCVIKPGKTE